jgi:hypothetical protein
MRKASFAALLALAILTLRSADARADDTVRHPGDHPTYGLELEPHGTFGWGGPYGGYGGFGAGLRFSIPIVQNGFVPTINNSVAITFGLDWIHYGYCYWAPAGCNANYVDLSVALQWNFYVAQHWSVFGEPGLYVYHGLFGQFSCAPTVNNADSACQNAPAEWGVLPAFYAGARYHFSDRVSLTMRVGFPASSIGVSFFF